MVRRHSPGSRPYVCGHCPWGDHRRCSFADCACFAQEHTPDDTVAATLFVVRRPDLSPWASSKPAEAAAVWRKAHPAAGPAFEPQVDPRP